MRRALTIVVLLALMGGFAYGVNRFLASRQHAIVNASTPTATHPAFSLPGTVYLAQNGVMYRLHGGTFTRMNLPGGGQWMQPALVPGGSNLLAVLRTAAYSEVFLIDADGNILRQLSHNQTSSKTIQLNHWMFWPHVAADGTTFYVSYDSPKSLSSYQIAFAVWRGSLTGALVATQVTDPFGYTGGDVEATPLANGDVLYAKYQINNGQVYSRIAIQTKPLATPVYLTSATDDCGEPAVSPDGTHVAMVCTGGTGLQSTRLEVASLQGTTLGTPAVLVNHCLCASPAWSPDSASLVYYNPVDATGHFQLWWLPAAATAPQAPRAMTQTLDFDATSPPAWSAS